MSFFVVENVYIFRNIMKLPNQVLEPVAVNIFKEIIIVVIYLSTK